MACSSPRVRGSLDYPDRHAFGNGRANNIWCWCRPGRSCVVIRFEHNIVVGMSHYLLPTPTLTPSSELARSICKRSRAKHSQRRAHSTPNIYRAWGPLWVAWWETFHRLAKGGCCWIPVGSRSMKRIVTQSSWIVDSHYSTRYRPGLDLVLKDVNVDIVRFVIVFGKDNLIVF